MTALSSPPSPVVVWLGGAPPELRGVRLERCASVEELGRRGSLPEVVVFHEADGLPIEECLYQASLPAFASIAVVVVAQTWVEPLFWQAARAGAFCCVPASVGPAGLEAAIGAALGETTGRRHRLLPRPDVLAAVRCLVRTELSIASLTDAEIVASLAAAVTPSPERTVGGVLELLINAIEHGNLGIGFQDKRELLRQGRLQAEVARRLETSPWRERRARVVIERLPQLVRLEVADEGQGFDFERVLRQLPDLTAPHGRGIFLARTLSFTRLRYQGNGNHVIAEVDVP